MRYPPINSKFPHFIHGSDYNPEQWPRHIWDEDLRLMKLAHCNTMTVGVFSWAKLEPAEGEFDFEWLDVVLDKLAANAMHAILATPSGARPTWMSHRYPEVLRVAPDRRRIRHCMRQNHCFTSPVYREKVGIINRKLAERYGEHPALLLWHVSNEYSGECHCPLCQEAFREWLKRKYNSLDELNESWWTTFWSHTFTDWSEIEPPGPHPHGEWGIHGLTLDWKRFVTDQTIDFFRNEIVPLRELTPEVPVTATFMGTYPKLNYWKLAKEMDVISWDCYPRWRGDDSDWEVAVETSFTHDINRSFKNGKPFILMESSPGTTTWAPVAKLKRPGAHRLASLQAVAHGSDTVQYFQWRKSRGSLEKFEGGIIDHGGREDTRVFRYVAEMGALLERLDPVIGTTIHPQVAIIYDWENSWAIEAARGLRQDKGYLSTCVRHYRQFWSQSVSTNVVDMECDFSTYDLLIAPMLYMVRPGVAERIEKFVRAGGTFVATYWSGIVDENDLCFTNGFPGPLMECLGIRSEEIDALYDGEHNRIVLAEGNMLSMAGEYEARELCDLIHATTSDVLASYAQDFYAGRPALTVNYFGDGKAYYIASRNDDSFLSDFYRSLAGQIGLSRAVRAPLPQGVTAQLRSDGTREFVFLLNFNTTPQTVDLTGENFVDLIDSRDMNGQIELEGFASLVLERM